MPRRSTVGSLTMKLFMGGGDNKNTFYYIHLSFVTIGTIGYQIDLVAY